MARKSPSRICFLEWNKNFTRLEFAANSKKIAVENGMPWSFSRGVYGPSTRRSMGPTGSSM
jgi:hypothetical protein